MIIEMISGIHVTNKDIFLSRCRQYEREFSDIKSSAYDSISWEWGSAERRVSNSVEENDWEQWEQWGDWHNIMVPETWI